MNNASTFVDCLVCGVQTTLSYRLGALICEPCKRFFIRHRKNHNTLMCETGLNQCQVNVAQRQASVYTTCSGMTYRFVCTKCRFDKCVSVGVGASHRRAVKHRSPTPNVEETTRASSTPAIIPDQDLLLSISEHQTRLSSLVTASQQLLFDLHSARNNLVCFLEDAPTTWQNVMTYFQTALTSLKTFAQQLPGFQNLAVTDRCSLVARAVVRHAVAEACYHDQFGQNISFVALFKYIPNYVGQHLLPNLHGIAEFFKGDWHLDQVEFAFLLAFLVFYETTNEWNCFIDRHPFDEAVQQLQRSYSVYLFRVEAADVRRQKMLHALQLFELFNQKFCHIDVVHALEQFPELKPLTPGCFFEVCERLRQFTIN